MTAIASTRFTDHATDYPRRGTVPAADDQMFFKGTLVSLNASGEAVVPEDGDGFHAYGVAQAALDGRAGQPNENADLEIEFGVFGWNILGTTPKPRQVVYVVDNQTVSTDSDGGARGVAGVCIEVREMTGGVAQAFVLTGPQAFVEQNLAALLTNAALGFIAVPIGAAPAWADGTTNGIDPATFAFGFNPTIDDQPFRAIVQLPNDLDDAEDIVVRAHAAISSVATDNDVVTVLVARIDGGSDVAPVSATVLSVAAQEITFTIDAADVPAGAKSLYLEFDCAGTLDTHDAYLLSMGVEYTRTLA